MKGDNISFDDVLDDDLNVVVVALLMIEKYSYVAELYDTFGLDKLLEFLDLFGGVTFTVPSRASLQRSLRDVLILKHILRNGKEPEFISRLADSFSIEPAKLLRIYDAVCETLKTSGIRIHAKGKRYMVVFDGKNKYLEKLCAETEKEEK